MNFLPSFVIRFYFILWSLWIGLAYSLFFLRFCTSLYPENLLPEFIDNSIPPVQPPSTLHFFGTDELGRDVLIRLLFGTVNSFTFSFLVALGIYIFGFGVGTFVAFVPKRLQLFVSFLIETTSALPFLPIALGLASFFPGNIALIGMVKVALGWGTLAQIVRLECESLLRSPLFLATKSQGFSPLRIATRTLLPQLASLAAGFLPPLIFSTLLSLTALDFWGLGYPIPCPTLAEGFRQYQELSDAWWLFILPLTILVFLLAGIRLIQARLLVKLPPIPY